ncbi:MAG: class I SAM-dependent methyltransferase family protein [Nanoarchaeota archaeon]
MKLKELVEGKLTKKELSMLKGGHDVIGTIAILEIDKPLRKKRFILARALLEQHKQITTVLMKQGGHVGELRVQKMGFIMGKRSKETTQVENGVRLKLDVEKVYYSPRSANERMRIARQVKKGERVLVMFSGCAPYPLVIAKHSDAHEIVGVEKNPAGHRYGMANLALNKATRVVLYKGDARRVVPKLGKFDRVVMPLPKGGEDFLMLAMNALKKGGILHFYDFLHEDDIPKGAEYKIKTSAETIRKKAKFLSTTRCGQQQAYVFRTCTDTIIT